MQRNETASKVIDYLGSNIGRAVGNVFDQVEMAERIIDEMMAEHPDHARVIWNAFQLFIDGGDMFYEFDDMVYEAHVREILTRVVKEMDTRPATSAEMMVAVSEFTLENAPTTQAAGVFMTLFLSVMPEGMPFFETYLEDRVTGVDLTGRESIEKWLEISVDLATREGIDAQLTKIQRRLARSDRVMPDKLYPIPESRLV